MPRDRESAAGIQSEKQQQPYGPVEPQVRESQDAWSFFFCFFLYFGLCWVFAVMQAFGERGYSLVALHRLLTAVVSLVVALGL